MTDARQFQGALVAPLITNDMAGRVNGLVTIALVGEKALPAKEAQSQFATVIAVTGETPKVSKGAKAHQTVVIALIRDYKLPTVFIPIPLGKHLATYPYWVGQFEDDYK